MRDFSLDLNAEKIHAPRTKEYFREVIKSYYNESYRSAIVMLYSIALADLLYKLEELRDLYNDPAATEILTDIRNTQATSVKLSEWESKLVELVNTRTALFDSADHHNFKTLQGLRNLCAHPVMTDNFELYEPNRETTRAHIRNILEGILIKPALLSKKIFNEFMQNLVAVKPFFVDPAQLEVHLKSKYLDRFSNKVKAGIFRSLWKIALKADDQLSDDHRDVTNQALGIMLKNDYNELYTKISEEKDYFSDIDVTHIYEIIELFNDFPKLADLMNASVTMMVDNKLAEDADLDAYAFYRSSSIEAHLNKMTMVSHDSSYQDKIISTDTILMVHQQAILEGKKEAGNTFLIRMFANSFGYNMADDRYTQLINPKLKDFNKDEMLSLISAVNGNHQINGRRRARTDNYYIKERMLELDAGFSFAKFQNFSV